MIKRAICFALLCGWPICLAADSELATVVFMRSSTTGLKSRIHVCQLTHEDEPIVLGALPRRGKIERKFEPGDHRFLVYLVRGDLNSKVESYLEASLAGGQTYYVMIPHEYTASVFLVGGMTVVGGHTNYPLVPFKNSTQSERFTLPSRELHRWLTETPESYEKPDLHPKMAKRIQKSLPRVKEDYDKFRRKYGDLLVLLPEDSHPSEQALSALLTEKMSQGVGPADDSEPTNLVARITPPSNLDPDSMREAILKGGHHLRYQLIGQSRDRLVFHLQKNGYSATYTVVYTASSVDIYSQTFRLKEPSTPVEHENWLNNFQHSIKVYLERGAEKLRSYDEIVDFDPEGLRNQPLGDPIHILPIPRGMSAGDVQATIARAGEARQYAIVARCEGFVAVRLIHRGYNATYLFTYDHEEVKMRSHVHKIRSPAKLVDHDGWAERLRSTLAVFLDQKS